MTAPTWFEFVKPRLSKQTMAEATAAYFQQYFPETYAEARLIADEAIARASRVPIPNESEMPSDLPAGLQLVSAIIELRATG